MITHTIIKHRPRIVATSVPSIPTNNYNGWVTNRKLKTSEEFAKWIEQHPFKLGTLLALDPDVVTLPIKVHMVIEIKKDYHMLDWDRSNNLPKCFRIVQIAATTTAMGKWIRWDSSGGYRLLSDEEKEYFRKHHNDSIQDCLAMCEPRPETAKP